MKKGKELFKFQDAETRAATTRRKYFNILDTYSIYPENKIQNAITYLVESYEGVLMMDIGKYKGIPEIIVALQDKNYYEWYIENIKFPQNICHRISEELYKRLYESN